MNKLTHLDESGAAHMVDVGEKAQTHRIAVASAQVLMNTQTHEHILQGDLPKGDVLAVARIAGIQAAKKCADLIPLCHPLVLTKVAVEFSSPDPTADHKAYGLAVLELQATCKVNGQTGVEMEALTAVSVAALTIYDMCKAIDKSMSINDIKLVTKTGGKSGDYVRS